MAIWEMNLAPRFWKFTNCIVYYVFRNRKDVNLGKLSNKIIFRIKDGVYPNHPMNE